MKTVIRFLTVMVLFLFTASALQASGHCKKVSPPECKVMVCQSMDITTSAVALLPVEHSSWVIQTHVIKLYPSIIQSIERGYGTNLQLAQNQIYIKHLIARLVPLPFVTIVDRNNKINHYRQTNATNNIYNQNCRHV